MEGNSLMISFTPSIYPVGEWRHHLNIKKIRYEYVLNADLTLT